MQVQQMLQSILRFCSLEETLVVDATAALARRRSLRLEAEERSKGGGWGVVNDRALQDPPGTFDGVPGYVITRLDECAADYSGQFDKLMHMLRDGSTIPSSVMPIPGGGQGDPLLPLPFATNDGLTRSFSSLHPFISFISTSLLFTYNLVIAYPHTTVLLTNQQSQPTILFYVYPYYLYHVLQNMILPVPVQLPQISYDI